MIFRKATIEDIDALIKLRIDFLIDDRGCLSEYEKGLISTQLKNYYEKHINKDFLAMLAEENGRIISAAFLVVTEKACESVVYYWNYRDDT